ncbi:sensor histidine kinase [Pararobbsia alpina]|uniref:histidine kinase n=1 Tax=Pararobbsia alpina TaxID=621374 RepID=A0A6S7BBT3_9BURK|nr:HAMP domain-containing sensor histidine kinase [Pararobbsia alpina]CAB3792877.1 Adaptive-response sensory-kinase SasA [Pararobbsia alpina]
MSRWRTSTFRLLALYSAIFSLSGAALVAFIYWQSAGYMSEQADAMLSAEASYFLTIPPDTVPQEIVQRLYHTHVHINYVALFAPDGKLIAGDIDARPYTLPVDGRMYTINQLTTTFGVAIPLARATASAMPSGNVLMVARDLGEVRELRSSILDALVYGGCFALLTAFGGSIIVGIRQSDRIRRLQIVARQIASGDLQRRLPSSGRDEIDLLAQIVNHMLDEIERLMGEIKSSCDNIAHDLRSPLSRARTMLTRASQLNPGPAAEPLDRALREIDIALNRFRAMLRISEIETMHRRSGFSTFDLRSLVEEIADLYGPLAEDKGLRFLSLVSEVPAIQADRALLFEALGNLIDNAIKFTPTGGVVQINLRRDVQGPRIDVIDSGPGIPVDERKAVTQRFYRSERTAQLPGSGLGLSVVAAILRLHNYTMQIGDASAVPSESGTQITVRCWSQPHA